MRPSCPLPLAPLYPGVRQTQHGIEAGYAKDNAPQQGSRLLRNAKVAAAIRAHQDRVAERAEIETADVLAEWAKIATADANELTSVAIGPCPGCGPVQGAGPDPDCPECEGEGLPRVVLHDTTKLSPSARSLHAGARQT